MNLISHPLRKRNQTEYEETTQIPVSLLKVKSIVLQIEYNEKDN